MYSDQSFEYEVKLITSNMVVQGSWVFQMLKNLTLRNQFNFKLYLKKMTGVKLAASGQPPSAAQKNYQQITRILNSVSTNNIT